MFSLVQSVCAVMISWVFKMRQMERKTVSIRGIHKVQLECPNHSLSSVVMLWVPSRSHHPHFSQHGILIHLSSFSQSSQRVPSFFLVVVSNETSSCEFATRMANPLRLVASRSDLFC